MPHKTLSDLKKNYPDTVWKYKISLCHINLVNDFLLSPMSIVRQ